MALVYFILWLAMNGRVTTETVTLGILVSAALHLFSRRFLSVHPASPTSMLRLLPRVLLYLALLFIEIVKANLQVIRLVLSPVIEVEPCLIRFRTDLGSEAAREALARRTASSSSDTRYSDATGPKVSAANTSIPSVTPVSSVGA